MYDVSSQSAFFDNLSYYTGWIWRTSQRIICSWGNYEVSTMDCPPTLLSVFCQASSLSLNTLTNKGLTLCTNRQPYGRHHGIYLLGKPMPTQHQKSHLMVSRRFSFAKIWNSFHLLGKKLNYSHLKDFLKYKYEVYLMILKHTHIFFPLLTLKSSQKWYVPTSLFMSHQLA